MTKITKQNLLRGLEYSLFGVGAIMGVKAGLDYLNLPQISLIIGSGTEEASNLFSGGRNALQFVWNAYLNGQNIGGGSFAYPVPLDRVRVTVSGSSDLSYAFENLINQYLTPAKEALISAASLTGSYLTSKIRNLLNRNK